MARRRWALPEASAGVPEGLTPDTLRALMEQRPLVPDRQGRLHFVDASPQGRVTLTDWRKRLSE